MIRLWRGGVGGCGWRWRARRLPPGASRLRLRRPTSSGSAGPGIEPNPCEGDQTTTYYESDGSSRVGQPEAVADPPIDCFYVYPTVSNQPTPNATQTADPEVRSIAVYQAQRFSTRCRVYAPLYREVTAAGVATASQTHDTSAYETAFTDVREAWLHYLREDNHGRGVVLIGHSQGSRIMRALIRREIDPDPAARAVLVSAIIPGRQRDNDRLHQRARLPVGLANRVRRLLPHVQRDAARQRALRAHRHRSGGQRARPAQRAGARSAVHRSDDRSRAPAGGWSRCCQASRSRPA